MEDNGEQGSPDLGEEVELRKDREFRETGNSGNWG